MTVRVAMVAAIAAATVGCAPAATGSDHSSDESGAVRAVRTAAAPRALRVCADPNSLPYSNDRHEGFENRLAELVAADLELPLEYTWWPQRRGFVRNTIDAGTCDVVMGVPTSFERLTVTRPYYRSSYVFLSRERDALALASFDDPVLKRLRIGVHMIGDDGANTPPAHALARRQIIRNVVGYSIYGDYAQPNPPARLVEAVAQGDVDVAIVWGPIAGYFARRQTVALRMVAVSPEIDLPFLPFVYDIGVGVNRANLPLVESIDAVLAARAADIDKLLDEFGVPHVARVRRGRRPAAGADPGLAAPTSAVDTAASGVHSK